MRLGCYSEYTPERRRPQGKASSHQTPILPPKTAWVPLLDRKKSAGSEERKLPCRVAKKKREIANIGQSRPCARCGTGLHVHNLIQFLLTLHKADLREVKTHTQEVTEPGSVTYNHDHNLIHTHDHNATPPTLS